MKQFFVIRIIGIASSCAVFYYVMTNYVASMLKIHPAIAQSYAWVGLSAVSLIGLLITKFQFDHLPKSQKKITDFHEWMKDQKQNKKGEMTIDQKTGSSPNPGPDPPQKKNLSEIVEAITGQSLAEGEIQLDLELEKGTELTIYGQKCKIRKGSVKVKPRKKASDQIKDLMKDKSRRRVA